MDDDVVCPLCCEELDISDRQFFPCKCGYQVCMWCWHRIRESESGLCPACRTPYGDDPHEFSAVDVEEVLKANKEKEAAAKKERDRQRQEHSSGMSSEVEGLAGGRTSGQMDIPKDRTQLSNMRVIRRNLVYAVGLPPSIAHEEQLKRPEYFGQYGKISKIVLNRNQITSTGEARRGTASAYVTFAHKEDTLACILALDGFYMDGRNIRASYGTSKYCSAFIKNVRCNNPECTYLHSMGDIEDTFTKQEIQAGYVTSGRDVEARQQQIVQQQLSAQSGAAGATPRRRVGGGGPSGTGKAATNPVFPPPSFDEAAKVSTANLVPAPVSVASQPRSVSATTSPGFASVPAAAIPAGGSISRSSSTGAVSLGAIPNATVPGRKGAIPSVGSVASRKSTAGAIGIAPTGTTAASVVAGFHSANGNTETPAPHTTLTPLTPLKRTKGTGTAKLAQTNTATAMSTEATKLPNIRTAVSKNKTNGVKTGIHSVSSNSSDAGSIDSKSALPSRIEGFSTIGGDVIASQAVVPPVPIGATLGGTMAPINAMVQTSGPSALSGFGGDGLGGLGGEVFDGPLLSNGTKSAIGAGKDKWNSAPNNVSNQSGLWGNGGVSLGGHSSQSFAPGGNNDAVGGGIILGGTFGGGMHGSGSSALASMLGINLPTGSGSLRESSNLWTGTAPAPQQPIASLNGNSFPIQGVIGDGGNPSNGLIGGVAIGGNPRHSVDAFGGGSNKSDIALLQSLLPGVHITSGGGGSVGYGGLGGSAGNDWNSAPGPQNRTNGGSHHPQGVNLQSSLGGRPIGQNNQRAPGSIW
ncbi:ring/Ubox like zinc-binding domain containing protein [Nitzschia inconspicua]|uniref:Ring/Ubox like zinc-binding domain containing protein n=1 Tax=Nitzschia inconspicua TaxID=303405 RepID=A0A9K3LFR3_9STRA|nr:ring/Ubox like zinc-binding domain containing protein [Nitzschia inconspicua]